MAGTINFLTYLKEGWKMLMKKQYKLKFLMTSTLCAIALVLSIFVTSVNATIVTWEFSGSIDSIVDSSFQETVNPYTGVFSVGDQWVASLTVDLDSPATPTSGLGSHAGAITDGSFEILSNNFSFDLWAQEYINLATDSSFPHVTMQYTSIAPLNDQFTHYVSFRFFDWSIPVPGNLNDLSTNFDLAVINDPRVTIRAGGGPTHGINFSLDSAYVVGAQVPEPATIALLGIGLVGLAGAAARRRRKKKAKP